MSSSGSIVSEPIIDLYLEDAGVIAKTMCEIGNPEDNSTFVFSRDGLRLLINGDRTSQVSAFYVTRTFNRYLITSENSIIYRFSFKDFIEIINLLKDEEDETKASLTMTYCGPGTPLHLKLESGLDQILIECDLREFSTHSDNSLMAFGDTEETAEISFYSRDLYKYIFGLDLASSSTVQIKFELCDTPVKIATQSVYMGNVELRLRYDDLVKRQLVMPANEIFNFEYKSKFIGPAFEALKTSHWVRIKCGSSGLLLLEHFQNLDVNAQSVEYFVLSEVKT